MRKIHLQNGSTAPGVARALAVFVCLIMVATYSIGILPVYGEEGTDTTQEQQTQEQGKTAQEDIASQEMTQEDSLSDDETGDGIAKDVAQESEESAVGGVEEQSTITTQATDSFYAIWDDATKTISFSATEPTSGTYEEVTGVKDFIQKYKSNVKTIDFAFTNASGQSEKIVLGEDEGRALFYECTVLSEINNISNLDTSNCTSMRSMFSYCHSLKNLDLSSFDTSNVTNMRAMFYQCYDLESVNVSSFDTSQVEDLALMFYMCKILETVDVSSFDTSKSRSFYFMFGHCYKLKELDASSFTSPNVGSDSVSDYPGFTAFVYGCPELKNLDISGISSNAYDSCFQNGFTGSAQIERLVLGKDVILQTAGRFAGCGLSGNWAKETEPDVMFTTAELIEKYSNDGSPENATWIRYIPEGHYYRTDGTLNQDNMWEVHSPEERFKGYCLNKFRNGVSPYYDRVQITSDSQLRELLDSDVSEATMGYAPLGNSLEEALVTIMYYGWPNDKAGIQAKYGLSDDEYMEVTQNAIWDFVDRYDDKSGPENQTEAMIDAYNELLQQRYANIPDKYELYVYTTWYDRYQNLISIRSLTDGVYGGVEVYKQDEWTEPLAGAEFTVYTLDGTAVETMTSGSDGYASICETDSYKGLPAGDYYVMETKAPAGYVKKNWRYYFSITESNKIVTLGRWGSQDATEEYMIFENTEDKNYKGGGISVKKISDGGEPLIGAEFTIYQGDVEIMTIISDEDGVATTGKRDLPLGSYTIKETKAPGGYVGSVEEKTFTIGEDNEFLEEAFTFTNTAKQGKVTLDATKEFKGGKLKEGAFLFQLQTMDGEVLQTVANDADGKVTFAPITYTAQDQGYVNYRIVEMNSGAKGIVYDEHEEIVTVTITDTGEDELECIPIYDSDGATFENKKTIEPFIEKTINDGTKVVLQNKSDEVTYTIKSVVPVDAINFKIIDQMPEVLEFADAKDIKILFDGESKDVDMSVKDGSFTMELNEDQCTKLAGSQIEITFKARIKEDADLTPYQVGGSYQINNVAKYIIDNEIEESTEVKGASLEFTPKDDDSTDTGKKTSSKTAKTKSKNAQTKAKGTSKATKTMAKVYRSVKTGDNMPLIGLALLCAATMAAVLVVRRRQQ